MADGARLNRCWVTLVLVACAPQPTPLEFFPVVGDEHFRCTSAWAEIGTTRSIIQPLDYRMTISEIELLSEKGPVKYELDENSRQRNGLALLDFEDGTGSCVGGTGETSFSVIGTPRGAGPFTGLQFRFGAAAPHTGSLAFLPDGLVDAQRPIGLQLALSSSANARWRIQYSGDGVVVRIECYDPTKYIAFIDARILLAPFDVNAAAVAPDTLPGCGMAADDVDCAPLGAVLNRTFAPSPYAVGSINHERHLKH